VTLRSSETGVVVTRCVEATICSTSGRVNIWTGDCRYKTSRILLKLMLIRHYLTCSQCRRKTTTRKKTQLSLRWADRNAYRLSEGQRLISSRKNKVISQSEYSSWVPYTLWWRCYIKCCNKR